MPRVLGTSGNYNPSPKLPLKTPAKMPFKYTPQIYSYIASSVVCSHLLVVDVAVPSMFLVVCPCLSVTAASLEASMEYPFVANY